MMTDFTANTRPRMGHRLNAGLTTLAPVIAQATQRRDAMRTSTPQTDDLPQFLAQLVENNTIDTRPASPEHHALAALRASRKTTATTAPHTTATSSQQVEHPRPSTKTQGNTTALRTPLPRETADATNILPMTENNVQTLPLRTLSPTKQGTETITKAKLAPQDPAVIARFSSAKITLPTLLRQASLRRNAPDMRQITTDAAANLTPQNRMQHTPKITPIARHANNAPALHGALTAANETNTPNTRSQMAPTTATTSPRAALDRHLPRQQHTPTTTATEDDFSFDERLRAALARIAAADMRRHGIASESEV